MKAQGRERNPKNGATLRIWEAAIYLGETEAVVRSRIKRGVLPYRRLGGRIVLLRSELDAYLMALPGITLEEARKNIEGKHEY